MQVTRVSPKRQITIPKEIYDKLHLEAGDFLEVDIKDEGIVLIPKKLISRDQQWFWTKEWQEKEKEADGGWPHAVFKIAIESRMRMVEGG